MPVEYNWVPDYEDPARMKREGRRGEGFFLSVTENTHGYSLVFIHHSPFYSAKVLWKCNHQTDYKESGPS